MNEAEKALDELCRKVAAGDPQAQEEFDRDVAPLIEIIARHSRARPKDLAVSPCDSGLDANPASEAFARAGRDGDEGLASRICRSLIEKIGHRLRIANAETLARKAAWPTQHGPEPPVRP